MNASLLKALPRIDHPLYSILLLVGIALLMLLILRSGQNWDGDYALYIMNARNVALGLPYGETGYIFNPANAINPAAYPPGFPLLLAPVYSLFGVDLLKMKILCIATFVLFLVIFLRIARQYLPPGFALATTAAVGLHPFMVNLGNSLFSEFPFMFFCYASLYLIHRLQTREERTRSITAAVIVAAAVAIAFATITRSIGVLLFPAALLMSVYHSKRLVTTTTVALGGAVILLAVAQLAFPADVGTYAGYFDQFTLERIRITVHRYLAVRSSLLGETADALPLAGAILGGVLLVFALIGFFARVRRVSIFEVFFVLYAAFLLFYPISYEPERYSMPVWPLLFLYCAQGMDIARRALSARGQAVAAAAACVTLIALYSVQYRSMDFGSIPFSVDAPPSRELFATISEKLPEHARVLARKPTIIALFTGREATIWPAPFTDDELWSYMARQKVDYVVQDVYHFGVPSNPDDPLDRFIQRNRSKLDLVFENEWFNVYRKQAPAPIIQAGRR